VAGHAVRQEVPSKYLYPEHVKHSILVGPLQVSHSIWQEEAVEQIPLLKVSVLLQVKQLLLFPSSQVLQVI